MHLGTEFGDTRTLQLLVQRVLEHREINIKDEASLNSFQVGFQRTDTNTGWREASVDFLKSIDKDQPIGDAMDMLKSQEKAVALE